MVKMLFGMVFAISQKTKIKRIIGVKLLAFLKSNIEGGNQ
jgi:hypothetical protein